MRWSKPAATVLNQKFGDFKMLILTRHANQSIIIGEGDDQIVITLLETSRRQSRIGIKAPKKISVHREEVYEKIMIKRQQSNLLKEDK